MTLESLADLTGVTKGHLSRFERDQKTLSLAKLIRVAEALRSSVAELLDEAPASNRIHLSKAADRSFRKAAASDGNYSFAALSRSGDSLINSFILEFDPDTEIRESTAAHHGGEEFLLVLQGAVEVEVVGQRHVLKEGDYLQFPGTERHNVRGVHKRSKVLVVVVER